MHPDRKLYLLFGLVLLLPLIGWGFTSWQLYRSFDESARERTLRVADILNEHAIKTFETQELVATQIMQLVSGMDDETIRQKEGEIHLAMKRLVGAFEQLQDIWIIDAKGHVLITSKYLPAPRDVIAADREYFFVHRDRLYAPGRSYVSEHLQGRIDPSAFFFQTSIGRYGPNGEFLGVIALSIEPKYFASFYAKAAAGQFAAVALVRDDGSILARYPEMGGAATKLPAGSAFLSEIREGRDRGIYEARSPIDQVERIYAYRKMRSYPLYVVASTDASTVSSNWRNQAMSHLYFGLPAVLGLMGLVAYSVRQDRRIATGVEELQREAQRRHALQEQLFNTQKLEALGQLTSGVAHDFNNILQIVSGGARLIQRRMREPDQVERFAKAILEATQRGASITGRLLSIARQGVINQQVVKTGQLLEGVREIVTHTLPTSISIRLDAPKGLPSIRVDKSQLEIVLINLATNASDAMPKGGFLWLSANVAEISDAFHPVGLPRGQYVRLSVSDTGTGMDPQLISRVTEPFFTTKAPGKGTGLGLAMAKSFAEQSGGGLLIESKPGQGTRITLWLPVCEEVGEFHVEAAVVPPPSLTAMSGKLRVLLVDDDGLVREGLAEQLASIFDVVQAPSGDRALEILEQIGAVDAVVTDLSMPGLDGIGLIKAVRAKLQDVPAILLTGYASIESEAAFGAEIARRFAVLRKPSGAQDIIDRLEALMAAA